MNILVRSLALLLIPTVASADEGMWTFDNFPARTVSGKYSVDITDAWLNKVRQSVTRHESGCTGSFVSSQGLVLTNHHCVAECLANLSSEKEDLLGTGFLARTNSEERRCPGEIISVLMEMEDVTAQVNKATSGLDAAAANEARKRELSRLEARCTSAAAKNRGTGPLACESVTLYQGGQYLLYKYKRYEDVRMVFAPEHGIAAFGGDPDNFNFPRWCLDMGLLRVYENGKPARIANHLPWRVEGPQPGEAVFVTGHPGSTNRLFTVSQLAFQRDVLVPSYMIRNSEMRGRLIQWSKSGDEAQRIAQDLLQNYENSLKVYKGRQTALLDDALFERKRTEERSLKEKVAADPVLAKEVGPAWDDVDRAQQRYRQIYDRYLYIERGAGFNSELFDHARQLVRASAERQKPNERRLREYAESNLPKVQSGLLAESPIYPDLEQVTLSYSFDKLREWLGPDDPLVRQVLGSESPDSLAQKLIAGTRLGDPAVRKALWEGGATAVDASTDPMIALARSVDAEARAMRKVFEDEVQAPVATAQEKIAAARFKLIGRNAYPDATFTLRASYGAVQGWNEKGTDVDPFTRLQRLYERATGKEPFRVPDRWMAVRNELDMNTPFNYVTTNDIIGGNSGSPLIDRNGNLVGLAFDGNIHSIAGDFWYDERLNRTVAVHPAIMVEALRKVYKADALLAEILRK